jgi:CRP/FNR family transcriptional regulator, cyclic AMP receptor protein
METDATDRLDLGAFLGTLTDGVQILACPQDTTLFSKGAPADALFYLRSGIVKISVRCRRRREAVLAILGTGDFAGQGCLAGQTHYVSTATTLVACSLIRVEKAAMVQLLADHSDFSRSFLSYLIAHNARLQEDLLDQLIHTSEQRLARALLLLGRFHTGTHGATVIPKLSQQTLADLVGTTRSRINYFMNRFREQGFIDYNNGLHVYTALRNVTLRD